jgi:hypothetical protein
MIVNIKDLVVFLDLARYKCRSKVNFCLKYVYIELLYYKDKVESFILKIDDFIVSLLKFPIYIICFIFVFLFYWQDWYFSDTKFQKKLKNYYNESSLNHFIATQKYFHYEKSKLRFIDYIFKPKEQELLKYFKSYVKPKIFIFLVSITILILIIVLFLEYRLEYTQVTPYYIYTKGTWSQWTILLFWILVLLNYLFNRISKEEHSYLESIIYEEHYDTEHDSDVELPEASNTIKYDDSIPTGGHPEPTNKNLVDGLLVHHDKEIIDYRRTLIQDTFEVYIKHIYLIYKDKFFQCKYYTPYTYTAAGFAGFYGKTYTFDEYCKLFVDVNYVERILRSKSIDSIKATATDVLFQKVLANISAKFDEYNEVNEPLKGVQKIKMFKKLHSKELSKLSGISVKRNIEYMFTQKVGMMFFLKEEQVDYLLLLGSHYNSMTVSDETIKVITILDQDDDEEAHFCEDEDFVNLEVVDGLSEPEDETDWEDFDMDEDAIEVLDDNYFPLETESRYSFTNFNLATNKFELLSSHAKEHIIPMKTSLETGVTEYDSESESDTDEIPLKMKLNAKLIFKKFDKFIQYNNLPMDLHYQSKLPGVIVDKFNKIVAIVEDYKEFHLNQVKIHEALLYLLNNIPDELRKINTFTYQLVYDENELAEEIDFLPHKWYVYYEKIIRMFLYSTPWNAETESIPTLLNEQPIKNLYFINHFGIPTTYIKPGTFFMFLKFLKLDPYIECFKYKIYNSDSYLYERLFTGKETTKDDLFVLNVEEYDKSFLNFIHCLLRLLHDDKIEKLQFYLLFKILVNPQTRFLFDGCYDDPAKYERVLKKILIYQKLYDLINL